MLGIAVREMFAGLRANYMNFREMTSMPDMESAAGAVFPGCVGERRDRETGRAKA